MTIFSLQGLVCLLAAVSYAQTHNQNTGDAQTMYCHHCIQCVLWLKVSCHDTPVIQWNYYSCSPGPHCSTIFTVDITVAIVVKSPIEGSPISLHKLTPCT